MAVGASVVALALDHAVEGRLPWPARSTLALAVFAATLVATRAVDRDDLVAVRSVFQRRRT